MSHIIAIMIYHGVYLYAIGFSTVGYSQYIIILNSHKYHSIIAIHYFNIITFHTHVTKH